MWTASTGLPGDAGLGPRGEAATAPITWANLDPPAGVAVRYHRLVELSPDGRGIAFVGTSPGGEAKDGALVRGYGTDLCTLKRVGRLIGEHVGVRDSESGVWHVLANLGFSCLCPVGRALERDESAIQAWKRERWPTLKKSAEARGQTVVFIHDTGISERPHQRDGDANASPSLQVASENAPRRSVLSLPECRPSFGRRRSHKSPPAHQR